MRTQASHVAKKKVKDFPVYSYCSCTWHECIKSNNGKIANKSIAQSVQKSLLNLFNNDKITAKAQNYDNI
jgi:hypothetical protein